MADYLEVYFLGFIVAMLTTRCLCERSVSCMGSTIVDSSTFLFLGLLKSLSQFGSILPVDWEWQDLGIFGKQSVSCKGLNAVVYFLQVLPWIVVSSTLREGLSGASLQALFFPIESIYRLCLFDGWKITWKGWWPLQLCKGRRSWKHVMSSCTITNVTVKDDLVL